MTAERTTTILDHPDGSALVEELGSGRRRITSELKPGAGYIIQNRCETAYPLSLIELILRVKGPQALCDEITRDESPHYVQLSLGTTIVSHINPDEARGKRLLDFGCGSGASTMVLARLLPLREIVGVDLEPGFIEVAEARRRYYQLQNVRLLVSPDADRLPLDHDGFDYIVLSGVVEHMFPEERKRLLSALWCQLRPGGILFVEETPHRYSPLEIHSTSLPLINYLPASLALAFARRFSKRVGPNDSWERLLRAGIRGSTEGEILRILRAAGCGTPSQLRPHRLGVHDRFDLWYVLTLRRGARRLRRVARSALRVLERWTGIGFVPNLAFAVRKD